MKSLTEKEYRKQFGIEPPDLEKRRSALKESLDVRKFEIELYWKRAAYFWTFIGAALAAYGAVQIARDVPERGHLTVLIASLGLVFSFAWTCVNKGSKRWQENWENHVQLLEDSFIGPLHRTVAERPHVARHEPLRSRINRYLTGPAEYSVTKINQLVSLFVTGLWILIFLKALGPTSPSAQVDWFKVMVVTLAVIAWASILIFGRSDSTDYSFLVRQRTVDIVAEGPEQDARPGLPIEPTHHVDGG